MEASLRRCVWALALSPLTLSLASGRPPNDDFAAAEALEGSSGSVGGSNVGATPEAGEPLIDGGEGGSSVWWRWVAPRTESATVHTLGSDFDTLLGVYKGDRVDLLDLVAENDDAGDGLHSAVVFSATAGVRYNILVDGFEGEQGSIVLEWQSGGPSNDAFADAEVLEGPSGRVAGSTIGATAEAGEPRIADGDGEASVWWRWTAPSAGAVTVDTFDSDFDTLLGVYQGDSVDALELVAENDDAGEDLQSRVTFEAREGEVYHIAVDGFEGERGNVFLAWFLDTGEPPLNDDFAARSRLDGPSGAAHSNNVHASHEDGEPDHAGGGGTKSVWWTWTPPADGTALLDTAGSTFDTLLAVYGGTDLGSLISVAANDDDGDFDVTSSVSFPVAGGTELAIAVDGFGGDSGQVVLSWTLVPGGGDGPRFLRGDCDGDGRATGQVTDAVILLAYNFIAGSSPPPCLAACDVNGDGNVTGQVTDAVAMLAFNFLGGPPPVAPFPDCGAPALATDETVGCETSTGACP